MLTENLETMSDFLVLLNFFKVLGNESRLKIIGILANRECTVTELAELLDVKEPTVSQHLNMLKAANLVEVRPEGNFRFYSFKGQTLAGMSKELFSREQFAALVPQFEEVGDEWERKVLQTFFRLGQLPTTEKKLLVVLKWLADKFEYGVRYTEKEVNEILTRYHPDYALLRRELVDCRYMQREKGIYWRLPAKDATTAEMQST